MRLSMAALLLCGVQVFAMPWRWHDAMPEPMPMWRWGDATLYVGTWIHARDHITPSVKFAVNCADFPVKCLVGERMSWWVKGECLSWWLNINYWGEFEGRITSGVQDMPMDWHARMCTALDMAASAFLKGRDVLFFCHHGKHRCGALVVVFLALILNISSEEAKKMYFGKRGLKKRRDRGRVNWLWNSLDLDSFVASVRGRSDLLFIIELACRVCNPREGSESRSSDASDVQESSSPGQSMGRGRSESRSPERVGGQSRSPSCSHHSDSSSASTAYSVEPGTRTNRTDVPFQGAWTCECKQLVAKWELYCTNWECGLRRPLKHPWREGDWICWACGNHNFCWKRRCAYHDCPTNGQVFKQWDWYCPKCGNHNFAKRQVCNTNRCRHPRPNP